MLDIDFPGDVFLIVGEPVYNAEIATRNNEEQRVYVCQLPWIMLNSSVSKWPFTLQESDNQ